MMHDLDLPYRQHLSDADRRLLARAVGAEVPVTVALADPRVERSLFAERGGDGTLAGTSRFLTFAVAVHRTAARLATASYVEEPWTPRHRIPVFDLGRLRQLLDDGAALLFLVELLASYTHVASGSTWERTGRGWRRRRFSELDPVRLAGLLEVVDPLERAAVYRRLGDLALFRSGVFPDHPGIEGLGGAAVGRLLRLSGLPASSSERVGGRALLELLGPRWYRAAAASLEGHGAPVTASATVIGMIAERFVDARRVLNAVTDEYLYPVRDRWFGVGR